MDLGLRDLAAVHGPGGIRKCVADPPRILEQVGLQRRDLRQAAVGGLARHAWRHRRLGDVRRFAERALHEAGRPLLLEVGVRAEPGFERLAAIAAVEIEHDHWLTTSAIGRRWLSAGMRERTSEMRVSAISAKPTPGSSPMSSSTSPHGSMTSEWPKVLRPSS